MKQWRNLNIQSLCVCFVVAFFILLSFPRIFIWPSLESAALIILDCFLVLLISWILAYHDAKE
jgi:hypothetical protein